MALSLLSEKSLPHAAQLIKYCPSMDLIALTSTDQQVLIYRLNGQRVYGATQKAGVKKVEVESMQWKPNGQLLAISWSDGSVRLVGAESGKVVHLFETDEGKGTEGVSCLGWAENLMGRQRGAVCLT
jgi:anaphase-promoting complex subunit 4